MPTQYLILSIAGWLWTTAVLIWLATKAPAGPEDSQSSGS